MIGKSLLPLNSDLCFEGICCPGFLMPAAPIFIFELPDHRPQLPIIHFTQCLGLMNEA